MRRAVFLSLIPASRSNPLKEMVNQYQFRYQDSLTEVTEEVFTEANDDVILEAFHTVKPSSPTPKPREFINFLEQFLALGRRVGEAITQRQAKDRLLDVIATVKVDALPKEIIKEETKVGLKLNYLGMIVFVMHPLMSRHKLAIKKGHIMRRLGQAILEAPHPKPQVPLPQRTGNKYRSGQVRGIEGVQDMDKAEDPEGHQDQERGDPELTIAEVQEICEAQVLAMSGRAGAGASSIPKCPACAHFRGRAAGGGTAPDTRRPSQQWQATPPGTAPRHPRGTPPPQGIRHGPAPTGAHSPKPGRGEPGPDRPPP